MIKLQFVLGTGLSSRGIAWFSAGHFSHVDCVLPDGRLLGARSDACGGQPPGVRVRPAGYENWKERVVMTVPERGLSDKQRFYDFLAAQIGKPYDSTAIWGFAVGRDWRDPRDWFCSELAAAALEMGGYLPVLYAPVNKITPAALALAVSAVGAVVG